MKDVFCLYGIHQSIYRGKTNVCTHPDTAAIPPALITHSSPDRGGSIEAQLLSRFMGDFYHCFKDYLREHARNFLSRLCFRLKVRWVDYWLFYSGLYDGK